VKGFYICERCHGKGGWYEPVGTAHESWEECWECRGEGFKKQVPDSEDRKERWIK
jgi:DnaJ-class molecular chaperone